MSNLSDFIGGSAPTEWVSGTTYSRSKVVLSPVDFCYYVRKVSGAGTTDPSADATNWQNTNGIKSIQRGVTSTGGGTSGTATITAVNTNKTELRYLGGGNMDTGGTITVVGRVTLTNSTTVTVNVQAAANCPVSWELTERY